MVRETRVQSQVKSYQWLKNDTFNGFPVLVFSSQSELVVDLLLKRFYFLSQDSLIILQKQMHILKFNGLRFISDWKKKQLVSFCWENFVTSKVNLIRILLRAYLFLFHKDQVITSAFVSEPFTKDFLFPWKYPERTII